MPRPRTAVARFALAVAAVVSIVAMHGTGADAHSCGDHRHEHRHSTAEHEHDRHESERSGESPAAHCGAMACIAIVAPAASDVLTPVSRAAALHPGPATALAGKVSAPEPPVPRPLPHV